MRRSNFGPGSALPTTPGAAPRRSSFEPGSNLYYYWAPRPPGDYSSAHPLSPWDAARILRGRGGAGSVLRPASGLQLATGPACPQTWVAPKVAGTFVPGVGDFRSRPPPAWHRLRRPETGTDCHAHRVSTEARPGKAPAGRESVVALHRNLARTAGGWPVRLKPWSYRTGIWAALRRGIGASGTPKP